MTTGLLAPLLTMVIAPLGLGMLCYFKLNRLVKATVVAALGTLVALAWANLNHVNAFGVTIELLSQLPLPIGMSLRLDRLSAVMVLLTNFLFFTLVVFNGHKHYMDRRFYLLFLGLHGLLNGIFLSNDLFNIYLLIELATIVIGVLIMYKKDAMAMYDGMLYLLVNMVAMALFLLGVAFLYKHFGRFDLSGIENDMYLVTLVEPLYLPLALMMTAACLKAALLPMYSWLPKAHSTASAPSIVSAVLSGIFVKTGVYLLLRVTAMFAPAVDITPVIQVLAALTALFGFVFAVVQTDIKAVLAYHTISQVGLMLLGFYSGTPEGYSGGLLHLFSHGVFKSLLFILAGVLAETYKSRSLEGYGGLWRKSPVLSVIFAVAMLSIMGAPLFSGGVSKYWILKAYHQAGPYWYTILLLITLGTILSFIKVGRYIFLDPGSMGRTVNPDSLIHSGRVKLRINQLIGLGLLAAVCLVLGQFNNPISQALLGVQSVPYSWWHGLPWTWSLWQKLLEFGIYCAVGFVLYLRYVRHARWVGVVKSIDLSYNGIMLAIVFFLAGSLTTIYWLGALIRIGATRG